MTDQAITDTINRLFLDTLQQNGGVLRGPLTDQSVLLQTGMDSLGFAILVTRLEEELGYDPFQRMNEPHYPVTFGDFVAIYQRHQPSP